jgi:hypothetical protein
VLSEAAVENDVIQIYTLKNFRVPNTYTIGQTDDQFLTKTSASAEYIPDSIVDAKGDIITATADNTPTRLAVSSASTAYLRPDPSSSTGLKWDDDAWTTYTPTLTNLTIGNGTIVGRYKQIGKTVTVFVGFQWGSTTTSSGGFRISLPVNANSSYTSIVEPRFTSTLLDSGTAYFVGTLTLNSATSIDLLAILANGTYTTWTNCNATTPFTWTNNDRFGYMFTYEAA